MGGVTEGDGGGKPESVPFVMTNLFWLVIAAGIAATLAALTVHAFHNPPQEPPGVSDPELLILLTVLMPAFVMPIDIMHDVWRRRTQSARDANG